MSIDPRQEPARRRQRLGDLLWLLLLLILLALAALAACHFSPDETMLPTSGSLRDAEPTSPPLCTAPVSSTAPRPQSTYVPRRTASPTPIVTPTPRKTPTPRITAAPTPTPRKTATPTPTPRKTATPTPTPRKTATPTPTPRKTATPTPRRTATPTPRIVSRWPVGETVRVWVDSGHARLGPGRNYGFAAYIYAGDMLKVMDFKLGDTGKDWYKVIVDGKTCWVSSGLVMLNGNDMGTVNGVPIDKPYPVGEYCIIAVNNGSVRESANPNSRAVGYVSKYQRYRILDCKVGSTGKDWYQIWVDGEYGWISSGIVTIDK